MRKLKRISAIAIRIWFFASVFLAIGSIFFLLIELPKEWWGFILVFIISLILTIPVFILLIIVSLLLVHSSLLTQQKIWLVMCCCVTCSIGYAVLAAILDAGTSLYDFTELSWLPEAVLFSGILIICSLVSFQLSRKKMLNFFLSESTPFKHYKQHNIETQHSGSAHQKKLFVPLPDNNFN